jgi:hypothetical protein
MWLWLFIGVGESGLPQSLLLRRIKYKILLNFYFIFIFIALICSIIINMPRGGFLEGPGGV